MMRAALLALALGLAACGGRWEWMPQPVPVAAGDPGLPGVPVLRYTFPE